MDRPNGPGPHGPREDHAPDRPKRSTVLLTHLRTGLLAGVVAVPPAINAQNIVGWAQSHQGLGMTLVWSWVVFVGLDVTAAACVVQTILRAQKGKRSPLWSGLIWVFALASAIAGYSHGQQETAGRDVEWFFPFMAIVGPFMLHLVLTDARNDEQVSQGRRLEHTPASAFGISRWFPVIGAFGETFCAWRVGRLEGITRPDRCVDRYRQLRPRMGWFKGRVLHAMRVEAAQLQKDREAQVRKPREDQAPKATTVVRTTPPKTAREDRSTVSELRPVRSGAALDQLVQALDDEYQGPPPGRRVVMAHMKKKAPHLSWTSAGLVQDAINVVRDRYTDQEATG